MRIVNLEEFRGLPVGTVFMKFKPVVFDDLLIKNETWDYDFLYTPPCHEVSGLDSTEAFRVLDAATADSTKSVNLEFDCVARDGLFDADQLFAVYEQKDIDGLINALQRCVGADLKKGFEK